MYILLSRWGASIAQWVKRWPTDLAVRLRFPLEAKASQQSTEFHSTQPFIINLPSSWYDWNTVEKDVLIHPSIPFGFQSGICDRIVLVPDHWVWQHTFVSPSTFSRRTVVSYWRKYVHEVLVNRLGGLSLPRKSVVRLTDRPDMTLDVYHERKKQYNTIQSKLVCSSSQYNCTERNN